MINPLIGMPQGAEWLVILAIVILVFGAAKLPDLARGTGQALRIFKSETKGLKDDSLSAAALRDPNNILSKRSVYFDYDSNVVKDEFRPLVTAHARYLQQNAKAKMRIEGNADDRGSREYNLALGQRRADAVKQMMQLLGARADQIEAVSFGEEKPKCKDAAEACWAQNRRGDIAYPSSGE